MKRSENRPGGRGRTSERTNKQTLDEEQLTRNRLRQMETAMESKEFKG